MTASRILFALPLFGAVLALAGPASAQKDKDAKLTFELYQDKKAEYRWRLEAGNNKVLATAGQGYKAKADAKNGIEAVKKAGAADAKAKFDVYEDAKKEYRWKLKSGNGQVVASSSEGYKAKADAEKAVETVKAGAAKAEVVEVQDDAKPGKK